MTVYRSRKGITVYCAKCRVKFHTGDPRYEASEKEITGFQKAHGHADAPKGERR